IAGPYTRTGQIGAARRFYFVAGGRNDAADAELAGRREQHVSRSAGIELQAAVARVVVDERTDAGFGRVSEKDPAETCSGCDDREEGIAVALKCLDRARIRGEGSTGAARYRPNVQWRKWCIRVDTHTTGGVNQKLLRPSRLKRSECS